MEEDPNAKMHLARRRATITNNRKMAENTHKEKEQSNETIKGNKTNKSKAVERLRKRLFFYYHTFPTSIINKCIYCEPLFAILSLACSIWRVKSVFFSVSGCVQNR